MFFYSTCKYNIKYNIKYNLSNEPKLRNGSQFGVFTERKNERTREKA